MKKRALISELGGQDGAYLAKFLLEKDYEVFGAGNTNLLEALNIQSAVHLVTFSTLDKASVSDAVKKISPNEIYNLSGQSSVAASFEKPKETIDSIILPTANFLRAIEATDKKIRFYNLGSSEIFGETGPAGATEESPIQTKSPYGEARAATLKEVASWREKAGLHASTGILFNHDSPLRPPQFVTKKIILGACEIAKGSKEKLKLGNLSIQRDWGWAPEYVETMWQMLQLDQPMDLVIGTGECKSLESFVTEAFLAFSLDWKEHVEVDSSLLRPTDISLSVSKPTKARIVLGWQAKYFMRDVIRVMAEVEKCAE